MESGLLPAGIRDRILAQIKENEVVDLVKRLVEIPSHRFAPRQETDVAEYLMRVFQAEGIESYLQDVEDGRCNVVARLPGRGAGPSLMFNGHIDTVPADDMENAFNPTVRDGKLYGRGAVDMKGGVAAMAYALISLKRAGITLDGDLYFTGVIGEEQALSQGARYVGEHGPKADMAVVGEATDLETVIAHKGFDNYLIEVEGVATHSSEPHNGVNAIAQAARIIRAIEEELIPATQKKTHAYLTPPSINVAGVIGCARNDSAFLRGDTAKIPGAIVPDMCSIYIDRRRIPGETLEGILQEFQSLLDKLAAEDPRLKAQVRFLPPAPGFETHPPLETDPDHPLVQHCLHWTEYVVGKPARPKGVPYWSDAAVFNGLYGIPTIVFGPGYMGVAHSRDEHVPVDHLLKAAQVYALLAASVCRAGE